MKDYYYILGVTRTASTDAIKQAYRKLSVKFHPDKNDGDKFFEDRFKEINEAYEVLGNSARRASYDTAFAGKAAPEPRPSTNQTPPRSEPARIISFTADKSSVAIGDVITFSWEVKNATSVELKPFGKVLLTGHKAIKVLGFNQPTGLIALLEAKDETGNVVIAQLLIYRNLEQTSNGGRTVLVPTDKRSDFSTWFILGIPSIIVVLLFLFKPISNISKTVVPVEVAKDTITKINRVVLDREIIYEPRPNKSKKKDNVVSQVKIHSPDILNKGSLETDELPESTSNTQGEKDDRIYIVVEQNPEPMGGMAELGSYMSRNLHYPAPAQRANISGKVFVSFVVDIDGSIKNVAVLKGLGFGTDEEAVRVVQNMPKWKPGKQSGRLVRVKFNIPVSFTLE